MCFALTRALIFAGQIGKMETSPNLSVCVSHLNNCPSLLAFLW